MSRARFFPALPALALIAACCLASRATASDFPRPQGKVNDFAGLLTPEDREALEAQLASLERDTSAEVAVVTVQSLGGRALEEYATALFTEWGIGKQGKDNGVLVLVAVDDRAMRIEVGYGLEGVLPDGLAGAVIRETFLPRAVVAVGAPDQDTASIVPLLADRPQIDDAATAYVCHNYTCQLPTNDPETMMEELAGITGGS